MPHDRQLLVVDGVVDLALGLALIVGRGPAFRALGIPEPSTFFYTGVLGGVLVGIGVALLIQRFRRVSPPSGLGTLGATWINICGAGAIIAWLLAGRLELPTRGAALLWSISGVVLAIGLFEVASLARARPLGGSVPKRHGSESR